VNDGALVQDFDPASAVCGLIGGEIEASDFTAAQATGETDKQDGAITQPAPRRSRSSSALASIRSVW
jgi:hypothetical protein